MRPRTKSVVNVHEYFSQDDGESDQEEDEEDDLQSRLLRARQRQLHQRYPWMLRDAARGKALKRASAGSSSSSSNSGSDGAFAKSKKAGAAAAKRERTSTVESWEGTDVDEDDDEDFDDDDDDDDEDFDGDEDSGARRGRGKGTERLRTCSHDRRISFDSDVNVVTIPARSSFDAEYKRRVWYSPEEYSLMRQLD